LFDHFTYLDLASDFAFYKINAGGQVGYLYPIIAGGEVTQREQQGRGGAELIGHFNGNLVVFFQFKLQGCFLKVRVGVNLKIYLSFGSGK
jgi:hypothetical protein